MISATVKEQVKLQEGTALRICYKRQENIS